MIVFVTLDANAAAQVVHWANETTNITVMNTTWDIETLASHMASQSFSPNVRFVFQLSMKSEETLVEFRLRFPDFPARVLIPSSETTVVPAA